MAEHHTGHIGSVKGGGGACQYKNSNTYIKFVDLRVNTSPQIVVEREKEGSLCAPPAPTLRCRQPRQRVPENTKRKTICVVCMDGVWASYQRVIIEFGTGWGTRGHLRRTGVFPLCTPPPIQIFYIFIGWVGVGWQRRCKTRLSLRELDNQSTVFFFSSAVTHAGGLVRSFVRG